jgi:hypothetical protein
VSDVSTAPALRLWAVSSGWQGPFQHEEVLIAALGRDDAIRRAEAAFTDVRQPVCRAKMRVADLGPLEPGLTVGPRRAGEGLLADAGEPVELRCGVELPA